jgi:hypothetical protein
MDAETKELLLLKDERNREIFYHRKITFALLCYLERSEDGRSSNQKKVGKTIGSWARQLTVDRRPAPSGAFLGRHRPAAVNSRRVVLLAWRSA